MWDRALLKQEAKTALKRYYWLAFAACLCVQMIGGVANGPRLQISNSTSDSISRAAERSGDFMTFLLVLLPIFLVVGLILFLVGLAVRFFALNIIEVGKNRFFMEHRYFPGQFERLFFGFTGGKPSYMNIVKVMALLWLKTFLWSLLLVIPGIVKSYEYRMVPYLLSERPDMPQERAFELSRQMTDGEKFNIFVLDLSFWGWYLLGALACGIGVLFVEPYYQATNAELYAAMREKAFALGYAGPEELVGYSQRL